MTAIGDFVHGLQAPYGALRFILRRPRLIALSLVPFLISLALYTGALWLLWHYTPVLLQDAFRSQSWWWQAVLWVLKIVVVLLFAVAAVFTYSAVALAVGGPVNEFLSAAAERAATGVVEEEKLTLRGFFIDLWIGVTHSAMLVSLQLVTVLLSLLAVPVTTVIGFFVMQLLLALEYSDYPMSRRRMRFRRKIAFIWSERTMMFGFGLSLFLGFMVPFLGAIFMPLGVVAGTRLWLERHTEEERVGAG